ncbi:MAG: hypothetical protein ABJ084_05890 [Halioglobus sp.]
MKQTSGVSEMAIVDTFTKLIFGESAQYSSQELLIIQALRLADANVALDSHGDMGGYLRALGVAEMIHLVSDVQQQLASPVTAFVTKTPSAVVHSSKSA